MIDQRNFAQREARSLQPEQLVGLPVTTATAPQKVRAWLIWEDGSKNWSMGLRPRGPSALSGFASASPATLMRSGCGLVRQRGHDDRLADRRESNV